MYLIIELIQKFSNPVCLGVEPCIQHQIAKCHRNSDF